MKMETTRTGRGLHPACRTFDRRSMCEYTLIIHCPDNRPSLQHVYTVIVLSGSSDFFLDDVDFIPSNNPSKSVQSFVANSDIPSLL